MDGSTRSLPHSCSSTCSCIARGVDVCSGCAEMVAKLRNSPLESPLNHRLSLTKRHIPSLEEEAQAKEVIRVSEQRMAEIDATTARISRLLAELALERVRAQDFADLHKVIIAPVWNLPPEILSDIFMLCLPQHRYSYEIARASIIPSLLLASVNQHWRNIALGTPHLWTVMYIDEKCFAEDNVCMPTIFLNRSGELPLSLYVRAKDYPCPLALTTFVASLSRRWRHLTLDIEVGNLAPLFSAPDDLPDHLPALRSLDLKISSLWLDGKEINPFIYFVKAPLLEHVSTMNHFYTNFNVLPQWRKFKVWDSPVPLADFPLIFEWAPNLEHCFIQPTRIAFGQTFSSPETCCSAVHNLTSLHISTGLVANVTVQLHHLPPFPSLRRLFIYLDKHVSIPTADSTLVPFFEKSGAILEHVTLALNIPNSTLRACLTHMPSVTTLQIHRIATDIILGFLSQTPSPTATYLLPKLTTLRLSGKIYFTAHAVIKIINARWAGPIVASDLPVTSESGTEAQAPTVPCYPRSLKSVHILPPRHDKFDVRTRKELLSFKDRGFDVMITQFDRAEFIRHAVYNEA